MSVGVSRVHACVQTDSLKLMPLWLMEQWRGSCELQLYDFVFQ